jgi:hypothetical protein
MAGGRDESGWELEESGTRGTRADGSARRAARGESVRRAEGEREESAMRAGGEREKRARHQHLYKAVSTAVYHVTRHTILTFHETGAVQVAQPKAQDA